MIQEQHSRTSGNLLIPRRTREPDQTYCSVKGLVKKIKERTTVSIFLIVVTGRGVVVFSIVVFSHCQVLITTCDCVISIASRMSIKTHLWYR